jgi:DNA-binding beta-propeller fold protein YncE
MRNRNNAGGLVCTAALLALACGNDAQEPGPAAGPFKSLEVAANDSATFVQPLAGVPLEGGRTAFIALTPAEAESGAAEPAVFLSDADGIRALHVGTPLAVPLDIDVDASGNYVVIADQAAGEDHLGALLLVSLADGGASELGASGYAPVSVTIADDGRAYFSGRNPESGTPGVFVFDGASVATVYEGAPLVDPSGVALFADGRILVADTRLADENPEIGSGAGVVLIEGGAASVFVTGFETGYPAGIALTTDEKTLIVSGQGADSRDKVFVFDVTTRTGSVIEADFSSSQLSSGGLKRSRGENTFVWSSLAFGGGTVYTIKG